MAHPLTNEVTRILSEIQQGDPHAAERLLLLVYDDLRKLAAQKLAHEKPGQTLEASDLLLEAYRRLVGGEKVQHWDSRRHFFAAIAEAMRRILIDRARDKGRLKRGGNWRRLQLDEIDLSVSEPPDCLLDVDEALQKLAQVDARSAELVKLRFFAGLTLQEAAGTLGIARRTANRCWAFARAWLYDELSTGYRPAEK